MSKLIELDAAIAETWKDTGYSDPLNVMTAIRDRLEALPTVDVVPVRHGRWITHHEKVALLNGEAFGGVYCSECGYKTHNKLHVILGCPFKYCPNCGARMDGKGNGNETD